MRLLRAVATVIGGITLAAVAVTGQASAAPPTSPYNTITFNGNDSFTFDAPNVYTYQAGNGGGEGISLSAEGNQGDGLHDGGVDIFAPADTNLTTGTFRVDRNGGASQYTLGISFDWRSCDYTSGSVIIYSVTRDSAGKLTSFAAAYSVSDCGLGDLGYRGEIRWNTGFNFVETRQVPRLSFDSVGMGHSTLPQSVTFTSTGSTPIKLGAATLKGQTDTFEVVSNGCLNATLAYGQTCSVSVLAHPQRFDQVTASLVVADNSTFGARTVQLAAAGRTTNAGNYFPLPPNRILDTRDGTGGYTPSPIGPGQTLRIKADWVLGSNFAGAAVVLNVTVDSPTSAGFLTLFPAGTARPTASSLNFPAGWVGANSVTVPLGVNGQVDIFNAAGRTNVIVDEVGFYYGADDVNYGWGGEYQPHDPTRLLDTREDGGGALPGFYYATVLADYGAAANPHVKALAVNITAVDPQQAGYLTAWSGQDPLPYASTLNFTPHTVVPNFAVIPASPCTIVPQCAGIPSIAILNASGGATHLVVDVVGFYDDAQLGGGLRFHPLSPTRITDTREGLGAPHTLTGNSTTTITAPGSVAKADTVALVANVTGVNPSNATYLTVFPAGTQRPTASTLNLTPHEIRANASIVLLNGNKQFNVYNAAWNVDLVLDVSGTFEVYPYPLPLAAAKATSSGAQQTKRAPTPGAPLVRPLH